VKENPHPTKATAQATSKKKLPSLDAQPMINPDWFYRVSDGWKFFGYRNSVLHVKISTGEIPTPIALSDGGRARGWFGRTILEWQREREAKPAAKLVVAKPARKAVGRHA
jgi:hypothetical protein